LLGAIKQKAFKLIKSWIKFGTNIFENNEIFIMLFENLNNETAEIIQEIYLETFPNSINSQIYNVYEKYQIEEIVSICNNNELKAINILILTISNLIKNFQDIHMIENNFIIVNALANIYSSLLENYVYVLFLVNY
jgi:hypothetical protein